MQNYDINFNLNKKTELSYLDEFNLIKSNIFQNNILFNAQLPKQLQFDQSYELVIDYVTYPIQYQLVKTTDKVIYDRSPIPQFTYKGQMVTRKQLDDSFMKSILFNISKYHQRFVSNIEYFGKTKFVIYHPNVNNYVEYDSTNGLYKIDFDNPNFNNDKLDDKYIIEQVVELYNVSRNETYQVVETGNRYIKFVAPNQNNEVVEDIKNSFYRITMYLSTKYVQKDIINFDITSSYDLFFDKFFYVLKYVGNRHFDVFSIDFNQLQYYMQDNQLSFYDIMEQIQNNDFDLGQTNINGVVKEQTLNYDQYNTQYVHDLTIQIKLKQGYQGDHTTYLDQLNQGDMFYFYVNRTETFTIVIDDVTGNRTHISQDEFSSIFQFDNCNYLIRGTFYIFDKLPIRIENRKHITINGIDWSSSILDFNNQDFSNTDCLFEVVDSKDVTFKDFKITTYDMENGEIRPETYTTDKEVYQVKVIQSRTDMKTSDDIKLEHLEINNLEQQLYVDENNIYINEPPRTYVEHITFKPHGLDVLELIISQQSQYVPEIDVIQILPFKDILIGDGNAERLQFNPKEEILHLTTNTQNHFEITFDDINNIVNFDVVNVQNQYHSHQQEDIVSGILPIERGGTGNYTYTNQGIVIYNQQTNKFETIFTKDDIVNEQRTQIGINIVDQNNTLQFTLNDQDNFKIRSLTPHIVINFDQQQKEVNFDIFDLVTSVNGKTGDVTLDYLDVGQQQDDHLHDDRYVQITQLSDYYTKPEVDTLLDDLKNSIVVEVIDIQTDPSTITQNTGDIYQIGTGQLNQWMGYDGNFQKWNGTDWDIIQSFESQLQFSKTTNKLYICKFTNPTTKEWTDFVYYSNVKWINIDFTNSKIEDIENVDVGQGIVQGSVLRYDDVQQKWIQTKLNLEDISNIDTTNRDLMITPVICYDSITQNHKYLDLNNYFNKTTDSIFDINELTGLSLNQDDLLVWDQTNNKFTQVNMSNLGTSLQQLSDVDLTGLQDGYLLQYDETQGKWKQVEPVLTIDGGVI